MHTAQTKETKNEIINNWNEVRYVFLRIETLNKLKEFLF